MNKTDEKAKSFFQRLTESFINILPLNSSMRKENKELTNEVFLTNKNTRFASEAFIDGENDVLKSKRFKLNHDPMNLPATRILRVNTSITIEKLKPMYNDGASDISDNSNTSISTSGISSLQPRTNKRFNLNFSNTAIKDNMLRNVSKSNNMSNCSKQSFLMNDAFISSSARKILDNLDRISTPVTSGDKLFPSTSKVVQNRSIKITNKYQPYTRNNPSKCSKGLIPIKAVTVSASSNQSQCGPLRRKQTIKSHKKLGFYEEENVDLDIYSVTENVVPFLSQSSTVNFSNMPLLKLTQTKDESKNLDKSPILNFDFGTPASINDKDYSLCNKFNNDGLNDKINVVPPKYEFKRIIKATEKEILNSNRIDKKMLGLWRCNTCFMENQICTMVCRGCSNISCLNTDNIALAEKTKIVNTIDTSNEVNISFPFVNQSDVSTPGTTLTTTFGLTAPHMSFTIPPPMTYVVPPPISFNVPPPMTFNVPPPMAFSMPSPITSRSLDLSKISTASSTSKGLSLTDSIGVPPMSFESASTSVLHSTTTASGSLLTGTPISLRSSSSESLFIGTPLTSATLFTAPSKIPVSFGIAPTTNSNVPKPLDLNSANAPISFGLAPISSATTPMTFGIAPVSSVSAPMSFGLAPVSSVSSPMTFGIAPVSSVSAPISFGIAPVSSASAPMTFGIAPVSSVSAPMSFGIAPVSSASAPMTFGIAPVSSANAPMAFEVPSSMFSNAAFGIMPGSMSQPNLFNSILPSSTFTFGPTSKSESSLIASQSNPCFGSTAGRFVPPVSATVNIPTFNNGTVDNFVFGQSSQDNTSAYAFGTRQSNPFTVHGGGASSGGGTIRKYARSNRKKK